MKALILTALLVVSSSAMAWENPYTNRDYAKEYRSSTGTNYQYNLSNGSDRNRYSIDLNAQRRDSMSLDPSRSLDRGLGQYGGGIYND